ncbi:hypothetical protein SAMN05444161_1697 [Rhizobiales bacterium GAS191]|nr:hypothetical protein SAMN05519103_00805 [Rhizobiales bacterium GAS113]SEC56418.1 hypothetical protein SAMN05519104_1620 [Rhizobiales bacterium GAS188]SEC71849.1 hypothetical protein SAMN05444161_1697 [Rhizobiales bacterium GAS191]
MPKRLEAVLVLTAMVAAAMLVGIVLAKGGHSLFREERISVPHGKG